MKVHLTLTRCGRLDIFVVMQNYFRFEDLNFWLQDNCFETNVCKTLKFCMKKIFWDRCQRRIKENEIKKLIVFTCLYFFRFYDGTEIILIRFHNMHLITEFCSFEAIFYLITSVICQSMKGSHNFVYIHTQI